MNMRIKKVLTTLLLAFLIMGLRGIIPATSHAQVEIETSQPKSRFVAGRLLVKYRSQQPDRVNGLMRAGGAREVNKVSGTEVHVVELPASSDEQAFVKALQQEPDVEFAELDRIITPAEMVPNDPNYSGQWHLPMIQSPAAWSITSGAPNVTIAILDTGVDPTHPDLVSKLVPGWNFYDNNSDSSDVNGHGTAVAGAAAASSNNGLGVASVAWGCNIMPIRISDPNGDGTLSAMASGLTWAADHGARVANISYQVSDSLTVKSAAQYFQSKGGVVTISSGNDGSFDSTADNPYVLTVGATYTDDTVAAWSTKGNNLDLAAPGSLIQTTNLGGGYGTWSGTSFSAPIVAGVAALVMSANPNLSASQVQTVLKQSADDLGTAGWDTSYGSGRVNAARAVDLAITTNTSDTTPPTVSITSPANGQVITNTVNVQATAADDSGVTSVTLSIDQNAIGTVTAAPYSFSWDTTTVSDGVHVVTVTAADAAGNTASASLNVTIRNAVGMPVINIVSPRDGDVVPTGNVSIDVVATDDVAVSRVDLYVDGVLEATSKRAPFGTKWSSRKATAGAHFLQCKAYDRDGNVGTSPVVTVYK